MVTTHYIIILSGIAAIAMAQDPFYMCTESKCEHCPSSVASTGTGYPNCVVYNAEDVFANQGYNGSEGGGYTVYFDVQAHDTGCATIIKSPAGTDIQGCGAVIGAFHQPACALLNIESSFMVQSCCGRACDSAGAKMIRGIGPMGAVRSVSLDGHGGLLLKDSNGTLIEPAEIGPPSELPNAGKGKRQHYQKTQTAQRLQKRACTENSWKGSEPYTKPADNVQIVLEAAVPGPGGIEVTRERTQSWSTSMDLGISDIISLGVSTEFTESVSISKSVTVDLVPGQSGKLGFTATLSCSTGKGQCDGEDVEGEVCWPKTIKDDHNDDDVAGTYHLIVIL
ncbi:hypothetical protein P171DRAFT_455988 [Karstenula rhodostoma CBS 690.94]|uniref:Uncharacterized protein n=1 Tax=Karstenula rhodostoma CBS 690.94 TaxID=1392251 RepID=A0A9P4U977_9PLEO|nr:hypothetical protein P171DRAFT_455988 [Karstenula rhodostoma CBS 690.94]